MLSDPLSRLIGLQRGHLFPWVPVFLGVGIGVFFGLGWEPGLAAFAAVASAAAVVAVLLRRAPETAGPVLMAVALCAAGFLLAGLRTHLTAAPVLEFRYYGPIEGRVIKVDRSISDKQRVTLDRVILLRVSPARTPAKVRVSLHGDQLFTDPLPGQRVAVTGHLAAPSGPVEPHGFDFQRMAWFDRIGAVGYARTPMVLVSQPARGEPLAALNRLRLRISGAVQAAMPGQAGAFAAAVTTGDRSGLSRETLEDMRNSNLAHLLAISGLHVGLLTAFIFTMVRAGLALVPRLALRVPTKKWAAIVALIASAAYLALSGGNVSTQRAFIMAAVMLVAVLLDRRALTLRSVALAAVIVLVWQPESLLSPGFQMSFAATTALVWVFGEMRDNDLRAPKWARWATGLVMSSLVAGLATAPFAAAHFNQNATYGLLANLASVPLMGALVIPAAVLAACLSPFGLAWIGLWAMGLGISWILAVAEFAAGLDHAVRFIPQPSPMVMPLVTLGALFGILWRGRLRAVAVVPLGVALAAWITTERPAILVSDSGALVGALTPNGRALSRARGHGFVAQSWLENDGMDRDRDAASARVDVFQDRGSVMFPFGATVLGVVFSPKGDQLRQACADAPIVISNRDPEPGDASEDDCLILSPSILSQTGGVAMSVHGQALEVITVRAVHGQRVWNDRSTRLALLTDLPISRQEPDPALTSQLQSALTEAAARRTIALAPVDPVDQ